MTTKFLISLLLAFILLNMPDHAQSRPELRGMQRVRLNAMKRQATTCPEVLELEEELAEIENDIGKTTHQLDKLKKALTMAEIEKNTAIQRLGVTPGNMSTEACKQEFNKIKHWQLKTSSSSTQMDFVEGLNRSLATEAANAIIDSCDVPPKQATLFRLGMQGRGYAKGAQTNLWKSKGRSNELGFFRAVAFKGKSLSYVFVCTKYTLAFNLKSIVVPETSKTECTSFWWLEHCKTEITYKMEFGDAEITPTAEEQLATLNTIGCQMAERFNTRFDYKWVRNDAEIEKQTKIAEENVKDLEREKTYLKKEMEYEKAACDEESESYEDEDESYEDEDESYDDEEYEDED